jgi:hypothetical protein
VSTPAKIRRCAIYTRKSTEHGLEQEFNSLDAQREAAEAYIKSQAHEGGALVPSAMTMAASRVAPWTALPCRLSWPTSLKGGSTSSWSTRSIA